MSLFRSTPPREGRPDTARLMSSMVKFRSTPPREGRLTPIGAANGRTSFDPRPHARGDHQRHRQCRNSVVSIHAPTRGATKRAVRNDPVYWFRSTPPREGRRIALVVADEGRLVVSIHAPTRGATIMPSHTRRFSTVSIHAPTRGATGIIERHNVVLWVSIHAPTRGATPPSGIVSEP